MDAFCGVKTDALGRLKTAAQRLAFLHSIPTSKSEIQDQRRLTGFFLLTLKVRFKEGFCILFLRPTHHLGISYYVNFLGRLGKDYSSYARWKKNNAL